MPRVDHIPSEMQIHASCAAREGYGVLLLGPSGSGKSDLVLRLLDHDFTLVADDRVDLIDGVASVPPALAGLLEVRGLGILRIPHAGATRVALSVDLGRGARLPEPTTDSRLGVPMVRIDASSASAPQRVRWALDCALGRITSVAGAFA